MMKDIEPYGVRYWITLGCNQVRENAQPLNVGTTVKRKHVMLPTIGIFSNTKMPCVVICIRGIGKPRNVNKNGT